VHSNLRRPLPTAQPLFERHPIWEQLTLRGFRFRVPVFGDRHSDQIRVNSLSPEGYRPDCFVRETNSRRDRFARRKRTDGQPNEKHAGPPNNNVSETEIGDRYYIPSVTAFY